MVYEYSMRLRKQTLLLEELALKLEHGGELGVGRRKVKRPLVSRRPMHLVMRSSLAKGEYFLFRKRNTNIIKAELKKWSSHFFVKLYRYAIVGNHVHLVVKGKTIKGLQGFLRVVPGQIGQKITGSKKGNERCARFWDLPIYSRIVEWGRALRTVINYVIQNELEAKAIVPYKPRKRGKHPPSPNSRVLLSKNIPGRNQRGRFSPIRPQ